jgi:hypothetical protein
VTRVERVAQAVAEEVEGEDDGKIAAPGHIATHGAWSRKFFAVLSMLPQEGAVAL